MNAALAFVVGLTLGTSAWAADPVSAPTEKNADTAAEKKATTKKTDEKANKAKMAAKPGKLALPKEVKSLIIDDLVVGTGEVAEKGKMIRVDYTGWIYDPKAPEGKGKKFDTSIGKSPFVFTLGAGQVIRGWDEGFKDMKKDGKRRLIIPSEMGYGARGAGDAIKPNENLMFEVVFLGNADAAKK